MKNGVHKDIREGIIRIVDPKVSDEFCNRLDPEIKAVMKACMHINQDRNQHYKTYCMY